MKAEHLQWLGHVLNEMTLGNMSYRLHYAARQPNGEQPDGFNTMAMYINTLSDTAENPLARHPLSLLHAPYSRMEFILDPKIRIAHVNEDTLCILQRQSDEILGLSLEELLTDSSREQWQNLRPGMNRYPDVDFAFKLLFAVDPQLYCPAFCRFTADGSGYTSVSALKIYKSGKTIADHTVTSTSQPPKPPAAGNPPAVSTPAAAPPQAGHVRSLADYIIQHIGDNLPTIQQMARLLGVNQQRLKTDFKAYFDKTINEYVNELRMEKARELLQNTDLTNIAIAEQLGFESKSGFYRAFRKHFGCTPKEYREQQ
ncbi:AraC-type DNA-binding protein [Sinomicrobium oceani]|uniref:AraC-type DNA-binding protein n=1 Tax=Sinomicrobium oceani TaxID=1150368 RepID=A0A1K1MC92_9FLAO|nr:AraC family transcriptional regulator [Sinomicrobium oceani]SFW20755.1 AraC-type DNA-binding protein [Sinomicrobium oceani]